MLKYVLETVGTDKVTLGSDYPFPLGDLTIGEFIEDSDLPASTKEAIFRNNTLDWLNLDADAFS
jgi:aminocarboxymuconate-semialdehyde decarboxylase